DRQRTRRILRQQEIESRHLAEGRALIREYRAKLKEQRWAEANGQIGKIYASPKLNTKEQIRYRYKKKLEALLKKIEAEDLTNTSLKWFVSDRSMVAFWRHMADVNLERCYLAAERRLLSLGRCSPDLHKIVTELRAGREWKYEIELNPLHRYENRAWQAFFNEVPARHE
ncbi:MAG TPA: hypothetical protein VHO25_10035, partial [Polyangiaceae bacterium]|nr:hypothetical protein [Polyangiaceae bacterium]